jgi:hypothetical protein
MRASTDFSQSLYTTPDSIRMQIAPNLVSLPPIASSSFHSSSPVAEWIDADLTPFVFSARNQVVQNNRQNKIRYTFDISNCVEIFDILVLEKRIRIPADHVISSSKELEICTYCKWHDSFSHSTCDCNVFR